MRYVEGLVVWAAVAGCNGEKDDSPDGKVDTGTTDAPLSFTFLEQIPAEEYKASAADKAVLAHQISTMVVASAGVVAADEKVQDRMNTDGGGGYLRATALQCWARDEFPMFSFDIDYTGCSGYDMAGGVFVDDHPSGPLLFSYQDFAIKERTISGVFALDTQGAYGEPLYWHTYNTDEENPGTDNPVQIGVELDGESYGVSYSGGASVNFGLQEWSMWGVMTVGVGEDVITVTHGAAEPGDVSPDEPTGNDVLKSSLNWLSCRCPTSGVEGIDLPLQFREVTIDIDDLEDEPDAIDDPSFTLDIEYELPGYAVLTHTECGKYQVDYTTEGGFVTIGRDALIGAISFQCATLAIDDEDRCDALLSAANLVDNVQVEITTEQATATALSTIESDFDGVGWCVVQ
ncbi:MAG: hypothetical protein ABMA64_13900 [Myxococcota bacterium]